MITVPELAADALGSFLSSDMQQRFGSSNARLTELVPYVARLALECIGNSDALYHNVEHTMLVTLAGRDILRGRALLAPTKATDYAHLIVACLLHDIGYVRGILKDDHAEGYVVDAAGGRVKLPRGASDAALLTHHVDRSILFVLDRIEPIELLDAKRIARAVECTRFPVSIPPEHEEIEEEGALLRAADLIGQLGYGSPADLVDRYPQFYWNSVSPRIETAIRYLNVTASGRQWIANLYSNVFRAERDVSLSGLHH